eukprot:209321-Chlamydomonas_euryale.AAC.13
MPRTPRWRLPWLSKAAMLTPRYAGKTPSVQATEDEVLLLLMRWVSADRAAREPALLPLARSVVRPGQMSVAQLERLDQHPDVMASRAATMLVAGMYLGMIMGCDPPGCGTGPGRRMPAPDRPRLKLGGGGAPATQAALVA